MTTTDPDRTFRCRPDRSRTVGRALRDTARRWGVAAGALVLVSTVGLTAQAEPRAARPDEVSERSLRDAARRLDAAVEQDLREHGATPRPFVDDAAFLRRASLRILGRIPTLEETRAQLGDDLRRELDRAGLTDAMFSQPGHVSRMLHFWADLFRARDDLARQVSGEPFLARIGRFVADNEPYDDFVRALLTATGPAHARGNGATGYLLRDRGMPHDNMANTARVFLGTRIECAQCHDHPFEDFSQRQFYELAAFQGGLRYVDTSVFKTPAGRKLVDAAREARADGGAARRAFGRLMRNITVGIAGSGTSADELPDDYAYDDANPGAMVTAAVPFGPRIEAGEPRRLSRRELRTRRRQPGVRQLDRFVETGSRQAFAAWVTAPDNPRFARVVGARMWKLLIGQGPVEPVDDLREDTVAANPALWDTLEQLVLEFDYDLRALLRAIARTRTFAREAVAVDPGEQAAPFRFEGPALERMTAEMLWDSLLTLAVDDPDAGLADPADRAEGVYRRYEEFLGQSEQELHESIELMTLRYTDRSAYRRRLAAMRRDRQAEARSDRAAERAALREAAAPLLKRLQAARRSRDQAAVAAVLGQIRRLRDRFRAGRGASAADRLVRASELELPAPPAHLLREFGQSSKETIEGSFDDANVPQALRLMNGVVDDELLVPGSRISRALEAVADDPQRTVQLAWLAVLQRLPTADEARDWLRDIRLDGEEAVQDLVWTLVNSHEFRFID